MEVVIKRFDGGDASAVAAVWNEVVEEGVAFPQIELLTSKTAIDFFGAQSYTGVAFTDGKIVGVYILHPNNVGRCGHICNASFAVAKDYRGKHIGKTLVNHCIKTAKEIGFGILQFNAVVSTNYGALALYKNLGFVRLGVIPGGFKMKNGDYADIIPHYITL